MNYELPSIIETMEPLDLNELCIKRPSATFLVRVSGDSMIDAGILPDDVLVVDRSLEAKSGDVVIAAVNQAFTVKELCLEPAPILKAANASFPDIPITETIDFELFGVVVAMIRSVRSKSK